MRMLLYDKSGKVEPDFTAGIRTGPYFLLFIYYYYYCICTVWLKLNRDGTN